MINQISVTHCLNCENPYPHLYKNGGGHCEDCKHEWKSTSNKE